MMKPFIKWAGGKSQLAPDLVSFFPKNIKTYVEPFLGGGAMFFHLFSSGQLDSCYRVILSDLNTELITAWKVIQQGGSALDLLTANLDEAEQLHNESYYYHIRGQEFSSPVYIASRFIYLNKAGFNGLYRVNKSGTFNVPFGKKEKVKLYDEQNLKDIHKALNHEKVIVSNCDYEFCCDLILASGNAEQYFIYFDPPYVPLNITSSFTNYTAGGFGQQQQEELATMCQRLHKAGVKFALSNADVPLVRELYASFNIHTVQATRRINCKGEKRGKISEVLVTNY